MAETMLRLNSTKSMRNLCVTIAGVQVHQATGKDHTQVYKRLQAKEIRSTDVFTAILDCKADKPLTNKEMKDHETDSRKLYIPVRWTWSKVQRNCTKAEIRRIQDTLAEQAKEKKHTCWMNDYEKAEGLGAAEQNEVDIVVISEMEMIAYVQQIESSQHKFHEESVNRWRRNENVNHDTVFETWTRQVHDEERATKDEALQAEMGIETERRQRQRHARAKMRSDNEIKKTGELTEQQETVYCHLCFGISSKMTHMGF